MNPLKPRRAVRPAQAREPGSLRKSPWSWALLLVAAVAIFVFVVGRLREPTRPAVAAGAHQVPWPLRGLLVTPSPDAQGADSAGAAAAAGAEMVEICGVGKVRMAGPEDLPAEVLDVFTRMPALTRVIAALGGSAEPGDRAVGLHYQAFIAMQNATSAALATSRDCENNEHCNRVAHQMGAQAAAPYRQVLAQLAAQSSDPVAFGLAFYACQMQSPRPEACSPITAARWAELEPDNGVPWLLVASEAAQRKDEHGHAEAMAQAAAARRLDNRAQVLFRPSATPLLRDGQGTDRLAAQFAVLGVTFSTPSVSYLDAMRFCESKALVEPHRRTQCDRLATLFIETDPSPTGAAIGAAIGERLGWPADRIAALKDEMDAIRSLVSDPQAPPRFGLDCDALASLEQYSGDMFKYGEVGVRRRQIAQSGRSVAELAREYRDQMRREREQAQQAPKK